MNIRSEEEFVNTDKLLSDAMSQISDFWVQVSTLQRRNSELIAKITEDEISLKSKPLNQTQLSNYGGFDQKYRDLEAQFHIRRNRYEANIREAEKLLKIEYEEKYREKEGEFVKMKNTIALLEEKLAVAELTIQGTNDRLRIKEGHLKETEEDLSNTRKELHEFKQKLVQMKDFHGTKIVGHSQDIRSDQQESLGKTSLDTNSFQILSDVDLEHWRKTRVGIELDMFDMMTEQKLMGTELAGLISKQNNLLREADDKFLVLENLIRSLNKEQQSSTKEMSSNNNDQMFLAELADRDNQIRLLQNKLEIFRKINWMTGGTDSESHLEFLTQELENAQVELEELHLKLSHFEEAERVRLEVESLQRFSEGPARRSQSFSGVSPSTSAEDPSHDAGGFAEVEDHRGVLWDEESLKNSELYRSLVARLVAAEDRIRQEQGWRLEAEDTALTLQAELRRQLTLKTSE